MSKRLKIAVQFFGHLRTYKECAPALKEHFLDKYNCDLFMHTWSKTNHNTKTWHSNSIAVLDTNKHDIVDTYGVFKVLEIEEQRSKPLGDACFIPNYSVKVPTKISIFGMSAQFYSMNKVNRLRENYEKQHNIKYDYIVCLRPDILLNFDFDILDLLRTLSPQQIEKGFFTLGNVFTKLVSDFSSYGATDVFYFGTPKVMGDVLNNMPDMTKIFKPDTIYNYTPELEFIKSVQQIGYTPYRLDYKFGVEWDIVREIRYLEDIKRIRWSGLIVFFIKNIFRFHFKLKDKRLLVEFLFFSKLLPSICCLRMKLFGFIRFNIEIGASTT